MKPTFTTIFLVFFSMGLISQDKKSDFERLIAKIHSFSESTQPDSILQYGSEAIPLIEDRADSIRVFERMGVAYYRKNDIKNALRVLSLIAPYKPKAEDKDSLKITMAKGLRTKALIMNLQGDVSGSYNTFLEAVNLLNSTQNIPVFDVAELYYRVSTLLDDLVSVEDAIEMANKSLSMIEGMSDLKTRGLRLNCYSVLANFAYSSFRLSQAIEYNKLLMKEIGEDRAKWRINYIAGLVNIGNIYQDLEDYDKALENGLLAEQELEYMKDDPFYKRYRSIIITNQARAYSSLRQFDQADLNFKEAMDINIELFGENHPAVADIFQRWAPNFGQRGDLDKMEEYMLKAMEIWDSAFGPNNTQSNANVIYLGGLLISLGAPERGLPYLDNILEQLARVELDNKMLYTNNGIVMQGVTKKIEALAQLEVDFNEQWSEMNRLYNLVRDQVSFSLINTNDSHSLIKPLIDAFVNHGFQLYNQLKDPAIIEMIWDISEISKSTKLLSHINAQQGLENSLTKDLLDKEKAMRDSIESYFQAVSQHGSGGDSSAIILRKQFEQLTRDIESGNKEYFDLKYNTKAPLIGEVQERLAGTQSAVLEYHFTDTTLAISAITAQDFTIKKVSYDSTFQINLNEFRKGLISPEKYRQERFLAAASYLYSKLLEPVQDLIANRDLTIVPTGKLHHIPFEALLTDPIQPSNNVDFKNLPYLIKKHNISYANSITLLSKIELRPTSRLGAGVLAFSPTYSNEFLADVPETDTVRNGLGPLSWTKNEVNNISDFFRTKVVLGGEASEKEFKNKADGYSILHIASHALVDDNHPLYSKIALSIDDQDSLNDGYIHTFELLNSRLNAEMAVLSACNTGFGEIQSGEGVMSLAQGFFYAGVNSVVMSLWLANDESTSKIMENFYRHLADGKTKDQSLRQAKLEYINQSDNIRAHPYYWAQFVANGNMRPIPKAAEWRFWVYGFAALLLLFGVRLNRKKQANRAMAS